MPILTKKFLIENKEEKEQVVTPTILDNDVNGCEEVTPNVTVDDQSQVPERLAPINTMKITQTELEDLEDKIITNSVFVDEAITESFYELNSNIIQAQSLLESISIKAIHEQYKILTECQYGTDEYNSEISALTEATGIAIIDKLIELIKSFISKAKDFLSKIGVTISVSLIDYEKWATNKESDLIEKASKYGSNVAVKVHKWNTDLLFETIPLRDIEEVAEDICPIAYDKDDMAKSIDKVLGKYSTESEAAADAYIKALAVALGNNPGSKVADDKVMAIEAVKLVLMGEEKDRYMEAKHTSDYLLALKKIKNRSSKFMAHMKNNGVTSHFNELIKDAQKEANKRADKEDSKKYQYFRLRFTILSSVQNAINDLYKLKCQCINAYAREMYNSLKQLDSYKSNEEKSTNESIDVSSVTNIIGSTLHE